MIDWVVLGFCVTEDRMAFARDALGVHLSHDFIKTQLS